LVNFFHCFKYNAVHFWDLPTIQFHTQLLDFINCIQVQQKRVLCAFAKSFSAGNIRLLSCLIAWTNKRVLFIFCACYLTFLRYFIDIDFETSFANLVKNSTEKLLINYCYQNCSSFSLSDMKICILLQFILFACSCLNFNASS
ncbi:hypothetical protein T05_2505, partial [Trichinella murrelli]